MEALQSRTDEQRARGDDALDDCAGGQAQPSRGAENRCKESVRQHFGAALGLDHGTAAAAVPPLSPVRRRRRADIRLAAFADAAAPPSHGCGGGSGGVMMISRL